MIGYVLKVPGNPSPEAIARWRDAIREARTRQAVVDLVLTNGAELVDMRPRHPRAAFLRRARARVR